MKKFFSSPFILRIIVGSIFIYAGFNKIVNPKLFEETLSTYGFFSDSFIHFIGLIFPWVQIILGALLISGYLVRSVASVMSILLSTFIVMTILSASKGSCQACGFLSESTFYKGGNPFILITINYLLLVLSIMIIMTKIFPFSKIPFSSFKQVILAMSILIVVFLIVILFTSVGIRSYEGKYISIALEERNKIIHELSYPENIALIGTDVKDISNIQFPINLDIRIIVVLTLHALDCGNCMDEAAYLEYLNAKYGRSIYFCAVVWKIGKTAIDNYKSKFSITYPFIEDPALLDYKIFSRYKSLIIIVSPENKILRIDPMSFNIKKVRDEYENVLLSYLE
jgi:uncharacterized membrane protein YphA (DoxX/SURF4 family)